MTVTRELAGFTPPPTPDRRGEPEKRVHLRESVGGRRSWIYSVVLLTAVGLGCVCVADAASISGYRYTGASVFFWLGLLLIFVPVTVRVLMRATPRRERLALVVLLGLAFYAVKLLGSPHGFTFSDEYIHLRTTQDILRTGHLFSVNPLLPTASYYPGLSALTAGLVDLTGLSPFAAGVLVIGVARILMSACVFLVAEKVTGSDRAAAGASIIYAANPMFLFWSASFTYENLALPLAAFAVWWLASTRRRPSVPAQVVTAVAIAAVVVTHHVVGFALTALLASWWIAECVRRRPGAPRRTVGLMALFAGASTLAWFLVVAKPAESYLITYNIVPAFHQMLSLFTGHTAARELYSSGGYTSPLWETIAGFAAIALILGALPPALYLAWRRRRRAPMIVAAVVAIAFPFTLVPRLAPDGVAISGRSLEYVFLGIACVVGLLADESLWRRRPFGHQGVRTVFAGRHRTAIASCLAAVTLIGNVTIGTAFYQRLPEQAVPQGYPWSVQADVIAASNWARQNLGIHQRFGAGAIDSFSLATDGEEDTQAENNVWPIFFADGMDATAVRYIKANRIRYLLVDWRMTEGVPATPGYYFSPEEPGAGQYRHAFSATSLRRLASSECVHTVYSAGAAQIVDVSAIADGSCTPKAEAPG
jgi:Dolichyl-phosphate-mannose-protein mannosyltransferase